MHAAAAAALGVPHIQRPPRLVEHALSVFEVRCCMGMAGQEAIKLLSGDSLNTPAPSFL